MHSQSNAWYPLSLPTLRFSAVALICAASFAAPALAEPGAEGEPAHTVVPNRALFSFEEPEELGPRTHLDSDATPDRAGAVHGLAFVAAGSEFDVTGRLMYRVRLSESDASGVGRVELGVDAEAGAQQKGFIAGYAVEDGLVTRGRLWSAMRIMSHGALAIDAHVAPGMRLLREAEGVDPERTDSTAVTLDTGLRADVRMHQRVRLQAGLDIPLSYEVTPEVVNDVNGVLFNVGLSVDVGARVQAFAGLETGGIFGADGDAGKYLTRGSAGVRMLLGGGHAAWHGERGQASLAAEVTSGDSSLSTARSGAPVFVDLGWRAMNLAQRPGHGPSFQLGVVLFERLKLGLAGFQRPGPINPATFTLELPEGNSYRGQQALDLRSDGAVLGVLVAPMLDIPRTPLRVEVPVTVGFAGFGFYLHGDDREVPDERRVSEWENELLDGRDSDFTLAIDAGVRVSYVPEAGWWQPYAGLHYLATPGYDATMADDYGGLSAVLGLQLGAL
ncbi:MAG: hypothetical protein Tsb0020_17840 [Haliangiales bacterium]